MAPLCHPQTEWSAACAGGVGGEGRGGHMSSISQAASQPAWRERIVRSRVAAAESQCWNVRSQRPAKKLQLELTGARSWCCVPASTCAPLESRSPSQHPADRAAVGSAARVSRPGDAAAGSHLNIKMQGGGAAAKRRRQWYAPSPVSPAARGPVPCGLDPCTCCRRHH